jgi:hypothetical protein
MGSGVNVINLFPSTITIPVNIRLGCKVSPLANAPDYFVSVSDDGKSLMPLTQEAEPYDAIHVGAASQGLPECLVAQLAPGIYQNP